MFDGVGVLAGLGAAVCFAAYFLIGEHGVGRLDPLRVILWSFGVATVGLNLVHPVTGTRWDLLGTHASLLGRLAGGTAPVWAVLAWIVVVGTLLPFGLTLLALRHLSATTVTMVAMLEPIGVSALGWIWFAETLDTVALVGGGGRRRGHRAGPERPPDRAGVNHPISSEPPLSGGSQTNHSDEAPERRGRAGWTGRWRRGAWSSPARHRAPRPATATGCHLRGATWETTGNGPAHREVCGPGTVPDRSGSAWGPTWQDRA